MGDYTPTIEQITAPATQRNSHLWRGKKRFFCPLPGCKVPSHPFPRMSALRQHYFVNHAVKEYSCDKCRKTFGLVTAFNSHLKSRCGERHRCDICNRTSASAAGLKMHKLRYHSRSRSARLSAGRSSEESTDSDYHYSDTQFAGPPMPNANGQTEEPCPPLSRTAFNAAETQTMPFSGFDFEALLRGDDPTQQPHMHSSYGSIHETGSISLSSSADESVHQGMGNLEIQRHSEGTQTHLSAQHLYDSVVRGAQATASKMPV